MSDSVISISHLVSNNTSNNKTYGEQLRSLYIASADKDTVNEYRAFFDTLCVSAFDTIKKNIKEGKPPIYVYNPAETDHGIILSSNEDERFKDPLFLIIMKEYEKKHELAINIQLVSPRMPISPISNNQGEQPMRNIGSPTPIIIISI